MTPAETAPDLDRLLERTSRTFALSIPMLPEPTRSQVTLAYLLFRIADTFEDAAAWPRERRIAALHQFADLVEAGKDAEAAPDCEELARQAQRQAEGWAVELPSSHEGYLELLAATPDVLCRYLELPPEARRIVGHHSVRTARGMAGFVEKADDQGHLVLDDEANLVRYCYVVAGIVGELLTDLFLLDRPALADSADYLRQRAALFGEALQLVNILKDSEADAQEGRRFLPPGLDRAAVFQRARRDLEAATEYVLRLQQAHMDGGTGGDSAEAGIERGLVAFTALPVRLAWATLDEVEKNGPGSKIGRERVFQLAAELEHALDTLTPAVVPPSAD